MASTNQTTHYELSQYIATDKPTYLVDYNGDMSKIDTGIYGAKSLADTNATSIGTLSSLDTTVKSDLVSAINEVNTQVGLNTTAIGNNTTAIGDNTTAIGTLANLSTTVKSDLVSATNEVNSKVGNIANLETSVKTDTVSAINELAEFLNIRHFENYAPDVTGEINVTNATIYTNIGGLHCASNDDKSLAKIYGEIRLNTEGSTNPAVVSIQTRLRPSSAITINDIGIQIISTSSNPVADVYGIDATINTNGVISFICSNENYITRNRIVIHPCLIFTKDFGDVPTPVNP